MDAFTIKRTEYTNRTLRFPVPLWEQLSEISQKQDISVNALIIQSIEYAIKNLQVDRQD